jgi:hypothetical protein
MPVVMSPEHCFRSCSCLRRMRRRTLPRARRRLPFAIWPMQKARNNVLRQCPDFILRRSSGVELGERIGDRGAQRRQFAADGYERTTIRTVATEADIDPATVMRYFGSKLSRRSAGRRRGWRRGAPIGRSPVRASQHPGCRVAPPATLRPRHPAPAHGAFIAFFTSAIASRPSGSFGASSENRVRSASAFCRSLLRTHVRPRK